MRVPILVVLALLLAPVASAAGAPAPGDAARALVDAVASGDITHAREVYAASFHDAFAARTPALDARLGDNLTAGANATLVAMMLAHGALDTWRATNDTAWWEVDRIVLDLGASDIAPETRAQDGFANATRAHVALALQAWDEPARAQREAAIAAEAYTALDGSVAGRVGASFAAQLDDEMASFVSAVGARDHEEASAAGGVTESILTDYLTPATSLAAKLQKVVDAARLLRGEYDEYVKDGAVVNEESYHDEVLGVFLPALAERWGAIRSDAMREWPDQGGVIDADVTALDAKVRALAPNAEVRALVQGIDTEAAEVAAPVTTPSASMESDIAAFHDAVQRAIDRYEVGDTQGALADLRSVYLDIYSPHLESRVLAAGSSYNAQVERILNGEMPDAIGRGAPVAALREQASSMDTTLEQARVLSAQANANQGKLLVDSFLIMLREGFESILVIGALATYLIRTGHKSKTPMLYAGAAAAVVATLALYVAVRFLVDSLPVNRSVIEGVTAIIAVVVLFYVSYWLLSKIEVGKWNRFIQGKMKGALLHGGSSYALAGVAFLAVFREGFETVLFYQGLYTGGGSGGAITMGVVLGVLVLALLFIGFYRFGVKIPMRAFFIVTSALLYYLAVVFAGAGVHEFQEVGLVSTTLVPWLSAFVALPVVSDVAGVLGVYPTWESIAGQGIVLAAIAVGLTWTFVIEPRRATSPDDV